MEDVEQPEIAEAPKRICKNCEKKMARKGKFCPHCGQPFFDGRIRLSDLLKHFLHNLTHLDNKFIKAVWELLIPAKVTVEYFKGKMRRYPHPVQFFFVVMFFFLLMLNKKFDGKNNINLGNPGIHFSATKNDTIDLSGKRPEKKEESKSFDFFSMLLQYEKEREIKRAYDSLPAALRTRESRQAVDSLLRKVQDPAYLAVKKILEEKDSTGVVTIRDSIPITAMGEQVSIAISDIVNRTPEEILEVYKIDRWTDRILVKQGLKSIKNPQGLMHSYIGSLTWTILALVALMSFFLMLLYWRQHRFYVEHFIFLLHQHTGSFLILTLVMLVQTIIPSLKPFLWATVFPGLALYLLIAMKRYYGQGYVKTTIKWMIYSCFYLIGFILLFAVGILAVFAFY